MTENEFIHIVPQLRQIALQISQGYGVGSEEAEDIAQDAMLKLWAIKDDIQSAAHAKGSMGCIAKHLCIDFFRKRKMISIDAQPALSIPLGTSSRKNGAERKTSILSPTTSSSSCSALSISDGSPVMRSLVG